MKKRYSISLFCLLLCILFAGCKKEEKETVCSHQYATTVIKEATCTESGKLKHTCSNCGFSIPQTLPTLSHIFSEEVTKEATCSEDGIITRTCTLCGQTEEKYLAPLAHTYNLYSLTPDCCTVCGQTQEGASVDPNGQWYGKNWMALGTSLTSEA